MLSFLSMSTGLHINVGLNTSVVLTRVVLLTSADLRGGGWGSERGIRLELKRMQNPALMQVYTIKCVKCPVQNTSRVRQFSGVQVGFLNVIVARRLTPRLRHHAIPAKQILPTHYAQ